jgi:hypothetical protein
MAFFRIVTRTSLVAAVLGASIAMPAAAMPAAAATPVAHVTVVHGLRGLVADIWLDGKKVLPSFHPERATDPIDIPAGKHHVDIRAEGAPESAKPLLSGDLDVPAGADLTVVAHLDAAGKPAISVYQDKAGKVPAGRSRVVVRHAAQAPGIGVELDQKLLVQDVAPGAEAIRDVAPGTHAVSVTAAAGSATPLLAPQDVPLEEGTGMVLYLIGSQPSGTLSWLAQPVRARTQTQAQAVATAPTLITTGDSGLRAASHGNRLPIVILGALLGVAALPLARRRFGTDRG